MLTLLGCSSLKKNGNYFGVSESSRESKKEDLFLKAYSNFPTSIYLESLNDEVQIKEVFIERKWRSDSKLNKVPIGGYQMIIVCRNEMPAEYSFDWMLGLTTNSLFSTQDSRVLVADVPQYCLDDDSFEITIYEGDVAQFKSKPDGVRAHTVQIR